MLLQTNFIAALDICFAEYNLSLTISLEEFAYRARSSIDFVDSSVNRCV